MKAERALRDPSYSFNRAHFWGRSLTMKRNQLLLLSVLTFGLQGVAQATPYPADAEASYHLTALDSYAEQQTHMGERSDAWGVSKRVVTPHNPFPFGGGYIDD